MQASKIPHLDIFLCYTQNKIFAFYCTLLYLVTCCNHPDHICTRYLINFKAQTASTIYFCSNFATVKIFDLVLNQFDEVSRTKIHHSNPLNMLLFIVMSHYKKRSNRSKSFNLLSDHSRSAQTRSRISQEILSNNTILC